MNMSLYIVYNICNKSAMMKVVSLVRCGEEVADIGIASFDKMNE